MLIWLRDIYSSSTSTNHLIPEEVRKDLLWWHRFLPVYNGISVMHTEKFSEPDSFSSDSSLSACVCVCGGGGSGKEHIFMLNFQLISGTRNFISQH